ncbi:MAG: hypothetical protein AAGU75_06170, partial [Bacillota bacterium]
GIVSGPILYVIWKKMYGGLAKKDPVKYAVNPKTGLAIGDMKRIACIFFGLAVVGGLALAWLPWFEGDWGPDYYAETYPDGIPSMLFGSFDGMVSAIQMATIAFVAVGIVCAIIAAKVEPKKGSLLKTEA